MEWVSKLPANETDGIEAFMILNVETPNILIRSR